MIHISDPGTKILKGPARYLMAMRARQQGCTIQSIPLKHRRRALIILPARCPHHNDPALCNECRGVHDEP